jgi:hypothetical protein
MSDGLRRNPMGGTSERQPFADVCVGSKDAAGAYAPPLTFRTYVSSRDAARLGVSTRARPRPRGSGLRDADPGPRVDHPPPL